ncbi:DUF2255 family protein [Nocardia sp. NBC_01327]|uniref:DUF2255 family protein n=1 Tax=Nocardia sp. NBC_01327 TaxID=2903593 RepID=UPI002E135CBA|nr:DUF2255 family protein [Nocardia sp. NBC_01327]
MRTSIDYLAESEVVNLVTRTKDGREITTTVGAVVVGGVGYVRSQRRAEAKWYKRALRTPEGALLEGNTRYRVTFEHITDPAVIRHVDRAIYAKYGGPLRNLALRPMLWWTRRYVIGVHATERSAETQP